MDIKTSAQIRIKKLSTPEAIEKYELGLKVAIQSAGLVLQQQLEAIAPLKKHPWWSFKKPRREWSWIQTSVPELGFQHICFALGTNIYSVLFAIGNNKDGFYVKDEELCTQITICANNNLIPCLMPLNDTDFSPALEESHLLHSDTREQVELIINKEPQLMSQWEKLDFSIQIVREALKCQGAKNYQIYKYPRY